MADTISSSLKEKGIDFDTMPWAFRLGRFYQRKTVSRHLTREELEKIPEDYWPVGEVKRTEVCTINMPPFNTVKNRVEVIFEGAEPIT